MRLVCDLRAMPSRSWLTLRHGGLDRHHPCGQSGEIKGIREMVFV
jgi:hypothetical protein